MAHLNTLAYLTFLLWLQSISCKRKHLEERVVGGTVAEPGEFSFMVSILERESPHRIKRCGGTVIDKEWILTAAHCVFQMNEDKFSIYAGSNKFAHGDEYKPQKFFSHPEYSKQLQQNDIALIKLNTPIDKNKLKKIKLNSEEFPLNTAAKIIGWGTTSHMTHIIPKLRYVNVVTRKCQAGTFNIVYTIFSFFGYTQKDDPKIICTSTSEGRGACTGDSGGPLIVDQKQIGIVSRGEPCATGYPDVFTNILSYADWITDTMKNN